MKKFSGFNETYDLTNDEKEIADWKAKKRLILRNKYLHEIHTPNGTQNGHIFDEQLQRHFTAFQNVGEFLKRNAKLYIWYFTLGFAFPALIASRIKKNRDEKEHKFRTGQISYRDRDCKFV